MKAKPVLKVPMKADRAKAQRNRSQRGQASPDKASGAKPAPAPAAPAPPVAEPAHGSAPEPAVAPPVAAAASAPEPPEPTITLRPPPLPAADAPPARVVEAALFSAGKPLSLDVLAENTRLPRDVARDALKTLAAEYDAHGGALEIGKAGDKWAMQVRAEFAPATARLAPMEIPFKVLKTLALIAYHQPVMQSKLIDMVGAKGYDHIQILYERGLVKRRVAERSFLISTTESFPEYFGIPATDRGAIKRHLATKLGIELPADDGNGNQRLDSIAEPAAASDVTPPASDPHAT
ncbi:MAG: SMC-Scp complex subunit ScpB [Thermoplasmatota archaeon]